MFSKIRILCCLFLLGTPHIHAQTLNWGNEVGDYITQSNGDMVDETFIFELGVFDNGFDPQESNVDDWYSNWVVFDTATYDPTFRTFLTDSTIHNIYDVNDDPIGVTNSPAGTFNFAGMEAYIWIRGGTSPNAPVVGTEWLLVRSIEWVFPGSVPECCGDPIRWSTATDLTSSDIPEWGRQYDEQGPGHYTVDTTTSVPGQPGATNGSQLQTYTFIPEPSAPMLAGLTVLGWAMRRKRLS